MTLFLLAGGCANLSSGGCCTDQVPHTERIDLYVFNRATIADRKSKYSAIWLYRLHEKGCAQLPLRRKRAG
jgi:hypothetical protein